MADDIVVWADIPVTALDRAIAFYEHVLQLKVPLMPGAKDVAVITPASSETPAVSADLYVGGKPGADGPTVYFSTGGDMDGMLKRVAEAGGTVTQEKSFMGPMVGWIAFFTDSEGNRIGLQQPGD
jgi:predicted enzyme related to lactoylglutathione lyase